MSDWQFASKEGLLRWTSPSLPDKGQLLYSVLSPTLLLGYHQQGDLLPVDYVKLVSVRRVIRSGAAGIELERDGGISLLVVAESPSIADDWVAMINMALQGQDSSAGMGPRGPPPAASRSMPVAQQSPAPQAPPPAQHDQPTATQASPQPVVGRLNLASSGTYNSNNNASGVQQQPASNQSGSYPPAANTSAEYQSNPLNQENCPNDQTGQHQYRPLSDFTSGGGNTTYGASGSAQASTTTYTMQSQVRPAPTPVVPSSAVRPLPSQSYPPASPSMSGLYPDSAMSRLRNSRPMDHQGGFTPGPSGNYADGNATALNSTPAATYPAGGAGGVGVSGLSSGGRPRSGMFVSLPATQTINRNIAPNLSAMWKEWQGPDGTTYLLFEPTGTMLRRLPGAQDFEMYVQGSEELTDEQLQSHPYADGATTVNLNQQSVRNLQSYGAQEPTNAGPYASRDVTAASVYRSEVIKSPRGQYSPSRHTPVEALASPRLDFGGYTGRRVHRVTLGVNREEPNRSVIQHEVETLGSSGLMWDPKTNSATFADGSRSMGEGGAKIGNATLHRQWEEVRQILMRGRYFKKHALRTNTSQFRMVFLTSDNAYVCAVPTSSVLQNASRDPQSFGNITETVQYYGPDTRAIPLNTVQHVSLGTEEDFVYRRKDINPEATFCIVSKTHAFVLECKNREEAEFYADAWTFFLYHSKPINPMKKRTPQMIAPVTHGTRAGVRF